MCAIAGMIDFAVSDQDEAVLLETMRRRGPDGCGVFQEGNCTLLHTRLAIIDPDGGQQPMFLTWAGENYVIVYNGELYNTEELRVTLEKLGHHFAGRSDTEVVLHAYTQWGGDCVERFNGIFAFGVWERKRQRLFLARDRIGVKPLFFRHRDGLIFASEIKTILACPGVEAVLDQEGAAQVLLLGPGRVPGSGVVRDIHEVEPGCCGWYEQGRLVLRRYWKLRDREHRDSFDETVECVQYLVTDAIRRQMVSDVPIGTFLSGGLDSSIITAVCALEIKNLPTFSVDYQNNDRYFKPGKFQPNSDSAYIWQMLDAVKTVHSWTVLTPEELDSVLEEATIARDLPGMADVDFSLLAFCKDIRTRVKVALSGECADEIFGGYPWYRDPAIREQAGFPWAQTTAQRCTLMNPELHLDGESYVRAQYEKTCAESDILPGTNALEKRMKEMVNLNFRWFMQTLLDRKDRMSMNCGLEVRVPFCDYRIAEYLYGVPWEFKDYKGREKGLLRLAVKGLLPESIRVRKKSPYPKTFDPGYEQLMRRRLGTILEDKNAPLFQLVRKQELINYLNGESQWPWYGQLMNRPQTIAYFVQLDFWLRHYKVQLRF